jgi:hypothetical protein
VRYRLSAIYRPTPQKGARTSRPARHARRGRPRIDTTLETRGPMILIGAGSELAGLRAYLLHRQHDRNVPD